MSDANECPSLEPTSRPRLAPRVRMQTDRLSGKPVLLYPEGVLVLNPTGAAILEQCDGQRTLAEVVVLLSTRFAAPVEQLQGDVMEYLSRLKQKGLLQAEKEPV